MGKSFNNLTRLFASWAFVISFIVVLIISWLLYVNIKNSQEELLQSKLKNTEYKVSSYLKNNYRIADMMAGYITSNPELTQEEFDSYAQSLLDKFDRPVLSVQWVEQNKIKYVYPHNKSKKVLRLKIDEYKTSKEAFKKSIKSKRAYLNGPVPLKQGGDGFIYRMPIYGTGGKKDTFQGLSAIVVELKDIWSELGLNNTPKVNFALKLKDSTYEAQFYEEGIFWGDMKTFEIDNFSTEIPCTGNKWILAVRSGWLGFPFYLFIGFLGVGLMLSLFISHLFLYKKNNVAQIKKQNILLEKRNSEKAILVNEVHHRVKNNFQMISSLARLQSLEIKDPKAKEALEEFSSRVSSMAVTHEHLFKNQTDGSTSIRSYMDALFTYLVDEKQDSIRKQIDVQDEELAVKKVFSLGIIINELITNSKKYAFDDTGEPAIKIVFHKANEKYVLIYKDNGMKLPENILDDSLSSFGIDLIKSLTEQIDGSIEAVREAHWNGFKIKFP